MYYYFQVSFLDEREKERLFFFLEVGFNTFDEKETKKDERETSMQLVFHVVFGCLAAQQHENKEHMFNSSFPCSCTRLIQQCEEGKARALSGRFY